MPRQRKSRSNTQDSIEEAADDIQKIFDDISVQLDQPVPKQTKARLKADDPREGARRTVRSACVAAEQRYIRSGGNPRHVWEAVHMCTHPDVAPMMLPFWCTAYLHRISHGLLSAEGDGDQFAALLAREIEFTRHGWSAVKDNASRSRAIGAALSYDKLRYTGHSTAQAYEAVRQEEGYAEVVSARKLVRRGKAMLSHTPPLDEAEDQA